MNLYLEPIIKPIPFRQYQKYSKEEIELIKQLYPDTPNKEIARQLGRKQRMIGQVGIRYGFKKSKEYMSKVPGAFQKGHIPANKGTNNVMKVNRTSFKEGNIPPNRKPIGAISRRWHKKDKRYYSYIKTGKAKWEFLSHFNYKKYIGKIILGSVITFKDGNTENCSPDNLKMITRAKNMKRNQNREKARDSLKKLWKREQMRSIYGLSPLSGFGRRLNKTTVV